VKQVETILQSLDAHAATFSEIGEHSPIAGIRKGMEALKNSGADIIVSVGGGSPIDASKAIIYNMQQETQGDFLLQIAIPTTLSAAEYTVGAGFTNDEGQKVRVSSPKLVPSGVILDAELTVSTPERLWLSTGMRAMDHAVESLYRPGVPLPLKNLCYAAIADLFRYLPLSKATPHDLQARQKLQVAAWMSLWPLQPEKYSALGLSHALGHKLGATYGIPHGITSCLTLAHVVALKAMIADAEDKRCLAEALFYLREAPTGSVEGDVGKLASLIDDLTARLGLQTTLKDNNVPRDDLPKIAKLAVGDGPEPLVQQVEQLLINIYEKEGLQAQVEV